MKSNTSHIVPRRADADARGPGFLVRRLQQVSVSIFLECLKPLNITPLQNTIIRTNEVEADRFGLNLSREPHGMAEAFLKLSEYRKPDPGALEEFVFFDHPSARNRIHDSMRWREAMGTP